MNKIQQEVFPTHWSVDLSQLSGEKLLNLSNVETHGFQAFIKDWMAGCGLSLNAVPRTDYDQQRNLIIAKSKTLIIPDDLNLMDLGRIVNEIVTRVPTAFADSLNTPDILSALQKWGEDLSDSAIYLAKRLPTNPYYLKMKKPWNEADAKKMEDFVVNTYHYGKALSSVKKSPILSFEELRSKSLTEKRELELDAFLLGKESYKKFLSKNQNTTPEELEQIRQKKLSAFLYSIGRVRSSSDKAWDVARNIHAKAREGMLKPLATLEKSSLLYGLNMVAKEDGMYALLKRVKDMDIPEFKSKIGFDGLKANLKSAREGGNKEEISRLELDIATTVQELTLRTLPGADEAFVPVSSGGDSPMSVLQAEKFNCFSACLVMTSVYADLGIKSKVFISVDDDFMGHAQPMIITNEGQAIIISSRSHATLPLTEEITGSNAWNSLKPWMKESKSGPMPPIHFTAIKDEGNKQEFLNIAGRGGSVEVSVYDPIDGLRFGMLTNGNMDLRSFQYGSPMYWDQQFIERLMQIDPENSLALVLYAEKQIRITESEYFLKLARSSELPGIKRHGYESAAQHLLNTTAYSATHDHLYEEVADILGEGLMQCKSLGQDLSDDGYLNLAFALERSANLAQAESIARSAIEQFPENIHLPCLLADILIRSGKTTEASKFINDGSDFSGLKPYYQTWLSALTQSSAEVIRQGFNELPSIPDTFGENGPLGKHLANLSDKNLESYLGVLRSTFADNHFGLYRNLIGKTESDILPMFAMVAKKRGMEKFSIPLSPLSSFSTILAHKMLTHAISTNDSNLSGIVLPALDIMDSNSVLSHHLDDFKHEFLELHPSAKSQVLWAIAKSRYSQVNDDPHFWADLGKEAVFHLPTGERFNFAHEILKSCAENELRNSNILELIIKRDSWNVPPDGIKFSGVLLDLSEVQKSSIAREFEPIISNLLGAKKPGKKELGVLELYSILYLSLFCKMSSLSPRLMETIRLRTNPADHPTLIKLTEQFLSGRMSSIQSPPDRVVRSQVAQPVSSTPSEHHGFVPKKPIATLKAMALNPEKRKVEMTHDEVMRLVEDQLRPSVGSIRASIAWPGVFLETDLETRTSDLVSVYDELGGKLVKAEVGKALWSADNFKITNSRPEAMMLGEFNRADQSHILITPEHYTTDQPCPILVLGVAVGQRAITQGLLGIGRKTEPFISLSGRPFPVNSKEVQYMALIRGAFNRLASPAGASGGQSQSSYYRDYAEIGFITPESFQTFLQYLKGGVPQHLLFGCLLTPPNLNKTILQLDERRSSHTRIFSPNLAVKVQIQGKSSY